MITWYSVYLIAPSGKAVRVRGFTPKDVECLVGRKIESSDFQATILDVQVRDDMFVRYAKRSRSLPETLQRFLQRSSHGS